MDLVAVVYYMECVIFINGSVRLSEASKNFLFSAITNFNKMSDLNKEKSYNSVHQISKICLTGVKQGISRTVSFWRL